MPGAVPRANLFACLTPSISRGGKVNLQTGPDLRPDATLRGGRPGDDHAQTDADLRRVDQRPHRPGGHPQRLGRHPARPRRPDLHRPPRPLRPDPGRLRAGVGLGEASRHAPQRPTNFATSTSSASRGSSPPARPARRTPSSRPGPSRSGRPSSRSSTPRPRPPSRSTAAPRPTRNCGSSIATSTSAGRRCRRSSSSATR